MSVTSKQILEATGLKSPKTLTRWAKAGIIPGPHIGTHPSGRGKIAYWPDWVLEQCRRIAELLKEGHTLGSASSVLETERTLRLIDEMKAPNLTDVLKEKKLKLPNGKEIDLDVFIDVLIVQVVGNLGINEAARKRLVVLMRDSGVAAKALGLLETGYNPVCIFDGEQIGVGADFMVSHLLRSADSAWLVIPILPALRKAYSALGLQPPKGALAWAAPRVQVHEGDAIVEYDIFLIGALEFELLRNTANTIGIVRKIAKTEISDK